MIRIQKLGHIGIHCRDVETMRQFYTDVLDMKVSDVNERGLVFLRFGADHHSFVLVPMPPEIQQKGDGASALQHVALEVYDLEELKKIRKYLESKGVKGVKKIKHEGPGNNYVCDFFDPEGNLLQFFCGIDQIGWDGKSRPKEEWKRFEVAD